MKLKDWVFWIAIIWIIILSIYMIYYMKTESFKCLSNPYTYSIGLLEESNNAPVTCICSAQKAGAHSVLLTREGFQSMYTDFQNSNESSISYNLSLIT